VVVVVRQICPVAEVRSIIHKRRLSAIRIGLVVTGILVCAPIVVLAVVTGVLGSALGIASLVGIVCELSIQPHSERRALFQVHVAWLFVSQLIEQIAAARSKNRAQQLILFGKRTDQESA